MSKIDKNMPYPDNVFQEWEKYHREYWLNRERNPEGLLEAISKLSSRRRTILEERYKNKRSFKAIGEIVGYSDSAVNYICTTTIRLLMRKYADICYFPRQTTNIERIKELDVEELADFLIVNATVFFSQKGEENCHARVKAWLKDYANEEVSELLGYK